MYVHLARDFYQTLAQCKQPDLHLSVIYITNFLSCYYAKCPVVKKNI